MFVSLITYHFRTLLPLILLQIDHVWPPKWHMETEGYLASQEGREAEIMQLTGSNERWENWMQYIQVYNLVSNYSLPEFLFIPLYWVRGELGLGVRWY